MVCIAYSNEERILYVRKDLIRRVMVFKITDAGHEQFGKYCLHVEYECLGGEIKIESSFNDNFDDAEYEAEMIATL